MCFSSLCCNCPFSRARLQAHGIELHPFIEENRDEILDLVTLFWDRTIQRQVRDELAHWAEP